MWGISLSKMIGGSMAILELQVLECLGIRWGWECKGLSLVSPTGHYQVIFFEHMHHINPNVFDKRWQHWGGGGRITIPCNQQMRIFESLDQNHRLFEVNAFINTSLSIHKSEI